MLDTASERVFDGITLAIANICEVPIALFSLVDANRQWFKSAYGMTIKETPRDVAFCNNAISQPDEMMVVEDATLDPRFRDNPLVTADPNIRFYAGKPIVTQDGEALGTLCVIDRRPRRLLPHQLAALAALSTTISAILDERYRLERVAVDRANLEDLLCERADRYRHLYGDSESILRGLLAQFPTAAVALNRDATIVAFNDAWRRFSASHGWSSTLAGTSYLDRERCFAAVGEHHRRELENGIQQVLEGSREDFSFRVPTTGGAWTIYAQPLAKPVEGALVQHFYSVDNKVDRTGAASPN